MKMNNCGASTCSYSIGCPACIVHNTLLLIVQGARITMDASGNIVIKRISKSSIFVNSVQHGESSAISKEVIDSRGHLDFDKPVKLFDMDKFRANVIREMKR